MRFRGTNINLPDREEPLTKERLRVLINTNTQAIAYKKPKNIITLALEKNRDNSILALLLHTKYRYSRNPEKQQELQRAFVEAILHRKYEKISSLVAEPLLSQLLGIIKSELGSNLAKAVHLVRSGKRTVQQAAQDTDVTTFDISYVIAYLNKESS